MGPTLEEALVGTDHLLYLELEGVSFLESLIPHLIDGIARNFMIASPAPIMGAFASSAH